MTTGFLMIPNHSQWQNVSSVTFAIRQKDDTLRRIDYLIKLYEENEREVGLSSYDKTKKLMMTCDLYFTTDYWLKMYKTDRRMESKRAPAVYALFERAAWQLCDMFDCSINGLPRELELLWGREMTAGGVYVDEICGVAEYLTRTEAARHRVWFKEGKAYHVFDGKKQLVDSKRCYVPEAMVVNCKPAIDYGFFVLPMSRDLYMAKHRSYEPITKQPGFYHSSYVAGSPVMCSGTMLIKNGVIERIRLNSGHYKPLFNNALALKFALEMWQVNIRNIVFEDYTGQPIGGGGSLDAGRLATILSNAEAFNSKRIDRSQQPAPGSLWPNRPVFGADGTLLPRNWVETAPPSLNRHLPA